MTTPTTSTPWIALDDLDCGDAWIDGDETVRWRTNRLFDPAFPFSTDIQTASLMGVYVELDPGCACERHTHDVEEVIVVQRGTLEFSIEDDVSTQIGGELSVVPAESAHAFRNVGEGLAGVLGILPTQEATTTFDRLVQPIGARVMGPDGPVPETGGSDD